MRGNFKMNHKDLNFDGGRWMDGPVIRLCPMTCVF